LDIFFFFQAEDGIRDRTVTGVQTCALPISLAERDMAPTEFANNPTSSVSSADALEVEVYDQKRYLRVERSASLRRGAKASKIWEIGRASCRERGYSSVVDGR